MSRHPSNLDGPSSPAWACQLIGFEIDGVTAVLDLVALEPRPGAEADWPRHTPFTIHMDLAPDSVQAVESVLESWSDSAGVVAITLIETGGRTWLGIASKTTRLVTQVLQPPRPLT
jgi:hypothetical protein